MSHAHTPSTVALAALAVHLTASGSATPATPPDSFRLLPMGRFRASDGSGRPLEVADGWLLDRAGAERIAAAAAHRASRRVIDYEHQTLRAAENGKPAPAAGWFGRLEAREDGLWAVDVEWTSSAAAMIAAREYRYVSPVFPYDKRSGAVLDVAHAALTNDPGLDGLADLAGLAAALAAQFHVHQPAEESLMKDLLKALGLAETATETEALAALAALKNAHATELAALKAGTPDPARYVEMATLTAVRTELATASAELAALKAERQESEVSEIVRAALEAGKLTPAMEGWAKELGKSNAAALKAFIASAPVVIKPGATQSDGRQQADRQQINQRGGASTEAELAVMAAMGLTAEQYALGKTQH